MRKYTMKKGSALLVVLGMLSFMVVSAVSFSIYMRENRSPSSYLRRNLAARHLVKAALANAIADLDGRYNLNEQWGGGDASGNDLNQNHFFGIYDDPYPGCGEDTAFANSANASSSGSGVARDGDYWFRRVFCPFGLIGMNPSDYDNTSSGGGGSSSASGTSGLSETVPTLTLEALAYLPPAIVDDVRRVSRLTRTACWRSLPYDSGRFAYTAVNVSDLFDINKLRANEPRDSGLNKITLATLCATDPTDPMQISSGNAAQMDSILDPSSENNIPFVSLADFTISAAGSAYAPFSRYVGQAAGMFLNNSVQEANALFITDTWFPPTNSATATVRYDLGGAHQPFTSDSTGNWSLKTFVEVMAKANTKDQVNKVFEKNLGMGFAALYDYLDSDNIPISLCIPTTEAVPMIVGVSMPANLKPEFGNIGAVEQQTVSGLSGTVAASDGSGNVAVSDITIDRKLQKKGITSFGRNVIVKVLATYPFKRMKTTNRAKNFTVRGLMRVWLAPAGMISRPQDANVNLYPEKSKWQNGLVENGVATFLSDSATLSSFSSKDVTTADDALDDAILLRFSDLTAEMPAYVSITEENPRSASQQGVATPDPTNFKASYLSLGGIRTIATHLCPLVATGDKAGSVDTDWQAAVVAARDITNSKYPDGAEEFDPTTTLMGNYRLHATLWIQVMDGNNVVDMVPACAQDDVEWLGANSAMMRVNATTQKTGDGAPLLNFQGDTDITFAKMEQQLNGTTFNCDLWKTLYAVDPRFNFAPENWFSANANPTVSKSEWLSALGANSGSSTVLGQNGRDRDIFMFVSDQEYMQSIGELQFIPALDLMDESASSLLSGEYSPTFFCDDANRSFTSRTQSNLNGDLSAFGCGRWMWRTFSAYQNQSGNNRAGYEYDPIYALPYNGQDITFANGTGTFKLNPFTRDDRVLAAALVGTPFDYYVASTNANQRQSGGNRNNLIGSLTLANMMSTYSFGQSSVAQMSKSELLDIMDEIRDAFDDAAQNGRADWQAEWDDLEWQDVAAAQINDQNLKFMGQTLQKPLHGVDRKFLYSFWRECFDNRQQLFLIFVRAEPCAVGGGDASAVSGQLGGRAVALVWRDPMPPANTGATREKRSTLRTSESNYQDMRKDTPPHKTQVLFYHQFD